MHLFLIFAFCSSYEITYTKGQKYQTKNFTGTWIFDCWGADGGGNYLQPDLHGKGAFLSVQIKFPEDTPTTLYFFAGESPESNIISYPGGSGEYYIPGGSDHGGSGGKSASPPDVPITNSFLYGGGGGGFTGISLNDKEEDSIVVAGSGGGAVRGTIGAPGGNISHCLALIVTLQGVIGINGSKCHNDGINGENGIIPTQVGQLQSTTTTGGGGAGFKGGPTGTYRGSDDIAFNAYGRGGRSFVMDNEDSRLTPSKIQITLIETLNGNEVTENHHPKTELHGKFVMTKIIDCDSQVCEEPDGCICSKCKDPHCDRCDFMSGICSQCTFPYKYDNTTNRCYVDSEPFSESFDFTVSEDFSNSFNFTATDVFSPTRSEKVIIVPESNSETKYIAIGCSVGGVVVIAAVVVLAIVFCRRKKLPFTSNVNEDSMKETVIPMQEDQLTVDDSSDSSMLSQHADDPFLPVNQQNQILAE